MNLANEGLEAKKKDEEVSAKKRKAEDDKVWEGMYLLRTFFQSRNADSADSAPDTREQRVDSWRSFSNTKKKKKTKVTLLG